MSVTRRVYDVHLNPEGYDPATAADPFDVSGVVTHRVVVIHADQMVGEREGLRRGITLEQAQNITSVIVWCALRRLRVYADTYEAFRDRALLDITNPDRPEEGQTRDSSGNVEEEVPPTGEPSPSASGSHTTTPDSSPTGLTPTSTNT